MSNLERWRDELTEEKRGSDIGDYWTKVGVGQKIGIKLEGRVDRRGV